MVGLMLVAVLLLTTGLMSRPAPSAHASALDDNLYRFLDTTIRSWLINGDLDLDIPVLDPHVRDNLYFDFDIYLRAPRLPEPPPQRDLVLKGHMENIVTTGLSQFRIDSVVTNLQALSFDIGLSLDQLNIWGEHYTLEGNIGAVPLYGEGAFWFDLRQITLHSRFVLDVNVDGFLSVAKLELDMGIASGTINFENLLGGGDLGRVLNDYLSAELPNLFEANKAALLSGISQNWSTWLTEVLSDLTLDDLLHIINSTPW
jgi:hypothetical protein